MSIPLIEIRDLHVEFRTFDGISRVLNGVNLQLNRGEVLGLVGETGSGKTLTALSVLNLIPRPPAHITRGTVRFDGRNVLEMSDDELGTLRGRRIAMIFQDPTTNLNPVFTIGEQLRDVILSQKTGGAYPKLNPLARYTRSARTLYEAARLRAVEALLQAEVPDPGRILAAYPHELSVGLRQRCLIAMALSGHPELLIADEPTTALDVRVEAQILQLIRRLVKEMSLSVLVISHNLAVVARICNRVAVMYAGNVVEHGPTESVLRSPRHPYTVGLIKSVPLRTAGRGLLTDIPGAVPDLLSPPSGCRFHPRCQFAMPRCREAFPPTTKLGDGHEVNCFLYE